MEELIGQQLGHYTIERMLGRGGMAAVFLAHDASMERQVAIKVLPREFAFDHVYVERFKREVKTIASLTHPNIVPVHAFGEEGGWTYIVMTYLPGGTLNGLIRQKGNTLPLDNVVSLVDQMASGLDYAHAAGIIHRDFKPANVLLGDKLHVALSDFGIAKVTASTAQLTGTGLMGTPSYMAPEMANRGGVTPLVDVYALGVTAYELLTGNAPFDADTPMGLMLAHVSSPVPDARIYRTDIPDAVQGVVEQAMAKDPNDRYQSAGAVADGLRIALGMAPVTNAGQEVFDNGATYVAPPRLRTPAPTAKPVPTPATVAAPQPVNKPKPNVLLFGGVAVAAVALVVGGMALAGVFTPKEEVAELTQPPTEAPTELVATEAALAVEPTARVVAGSGDFKTANSDFQALAGDKPLTAGSAVRTGADGVVLLTLSDGVSVEVKPSSVVNIDRLEVLDGTLFVELTQESGTTYHFINASADGLKRAYAVHTPFGTVNATGTQFWVNQAAEGWYLIPTDGSTSFSLGDNPDPSSLYVAHAANGDCLLVDPTPTVTDCPEKPVGLTLLTDGAGVKATDTPTPVVDDGGQIIPPTATVQVTATSSGTCPEQYYCSTDPSQKGTLIHVRTDCSIELLPGNPQCAGDLGGGPPPTVPGCVPGVCGSGGSSCYISSYCDPPFNLIPRYSCTRYDACGAQCNTCSQCGVPCF